MRELKPCPLCGSKATAYSVEVIDGYADELEVNCPSCNTKFSISPNCYTYYSHEGMKREYPGGDAIDIWNRRAE